MVKHFMHHLELERESLSTCAIGELSTAAEKKTANLMISLTQLIFSWFPCISVCRLCISAIESVSNDAYQSAPCHFHIYFPFIMFPWLCMQTTFMASPGRSAEGARLSSFVCNDVLGSGRFLQLSEGVGGLVRKNRLFCQVKWESVCCTVAAKNLSKLFG